MDMTHRFTTPVAPVGQNYAEWSYFDGYHFQHIAERAEFLRLARIRRQAGAMIERRGRGRGIHR